MFEGSNVQVTCVGRPHLGAPLGSQEYVNEFMSKKIDQWINEVEVLSTIARAQPHAAYSALTHGLSSRWLYVSRTVPQIYHHLQRLEDKLSSILMPALTNRPPPCAVDRLIFALPACLGGLGIRDPSQKSEFEYAASQKVCSPIKNQIISGNDTYDYKCECAQVEAKFNIRRERQQGDNLSRDGIFNSLNHSDKHILSLAGEKGASSWLTVLPIKEFGFCLQRRHFFDALCLRYGWLPADLPVHCGCGSSFTVEHALSCNKGGFPSIRHNEVRNFTADVLTEVCSDVHVEPHLQPVSEGEFATGTSLNTSDGARLDIAASGFWGGRYQRTYLDVRVFNPHAPSNKALSIEKCYLKHEKEKKRVYERRILEVEHSSFTPLVFSVTSGMGRECSLFYKRLASFLADKRDQSYNEILCWLRCSLSFMLLRSSIQCLRGARSSVHHAVYQPIDLITKESNLFG